MNNHTNTPIGHHIYTHGQILKYRGLDWCLCVFLHDNNGTAIIQSIPEFQGGSSHTRQALYIDLILPDCQFKPGEKVLSILHGYRVVQYQAGSNPSQYVALPKVPAPYVHYVMQGVLKGGYSVITSNGVAYVFDEDPCRDDCTTTSPTAVTVHRILSADLIKRIHEVPRDAIKAGATVQYVYDSCYQAFGNVTHVAGNWITVIKQNALNNGTASFRVCVNCITRIVKPAAKFKVGQLVVFQTFRNGTRDFSPEFIGIYAEKKMVHRGIHGKAMLHPYAKIRNLTEAEWASLKP